MTSTAETPFSQFIEALIDGQTHLVDRTAELAHESTTTWFKALQVLAGQQRPPSGQQPPPYQAYQQRVSELVEDGAQLTRQSTRTYVNGLKVIFEQQGLAYQAFQYWVSGVASAQSQLRQRLAESYGSASRELVKGAEDSAKLAGEAGADVAQAGRRSAPTRSRSASTKADGQGPAKWSREDYESLTAAEVVENLPRLSQHELEAVESYEKAHQSRQTVLQKTASLRGQEPMPGYDELNVQEIQKRLAEGDLELAARVRDYERPRKSRDGVLQAADAQLSNA